MFELPLGLCACYRQQMDGCEQFRKHKLPLKTPSQEQVHHMRGGSVAAPEQIKVSPHRAIPRFRHAQRFADDELLLSFLREARQSSASLFSQLPQCISIFAHDTFSNLNLLGKLWIVGC